MRKTAKKYYEDREEEDAFSWYEKRLNEEFCEKQAASSVGKKGDEGWKMHDIQKDKGYGEMMNLMIQVEKDFKVTLL